MLACFSAYLNIPATLCDSLRASAVRKALRHLTQSAQRFAELRREEPEIRSTTKSNDQFAFLSTILIGSVFEVMTISISAECFSLFPSESTFAVSEYLIPS